MAVPEEQGQGTLPLTVTPRDCESLPGLVMRLAERARFSEPGELARMAGLRQPVTCLTPHDLSDLACLSGIPEAALEAMSYRQVGPDAHRFLGGMVRREHISVHHRRACPLCLEENRYHRSSWDLTLVACCPHHVSLLVTACGSCSRKPGWRDAHLDICDGCGADLGHVPTADVDRTEADAARDVIALASGREIDWLPHPLDGTERSQLLDLVLVSGLMITRLHHKRRHWSVAGAKPEAVAQVVTAGISCLRDWPLTMTEVIQRRIEAGAPGRPLAGAQKTFGTFYSWMADLPTGVLRDAMLDVTREVVRRDPVARGRMHRSVLIGLASTRRARRP